VATDPEGHPVATGLLALVGVGLVVGLLLSGAALAATSVLGLGDSDGGGRASGDQSLYLPKPVPTDPETGPLVTLLPGDETPSPGEPPTSDAPEFPISLSASQTQVAAMDEIDLTGVYPGGEGAVVQVQRFENGKWDDFASVDAVVTNETFSTYVQTAQSGVNRFRVIDTDSDAVSNEVRVKVG
jgi:hypothetical protein